MSGFSTEQANYWLLIGCRLISAMSSVVRLGWRGSNYLRQVGAGWHGLKESYYFYRLCVLVITGLLHIVRDSLAIYESSQLTIYIFGPLVRIRP